MTLESRAGAKYIDEMESAAWRATFAGQSVSIIMSVAPFLLPRASTAMKPKQFTCLSSGEDRRQGCGTLCIPRMLNHNRASTLSPTTLLVLTALVIAGGLQVRYYGRLIQFEVSSKKSTPLDCPKNNSSEMEIGRRQNDGIDQVYVELLEQAERRSEGDFHRSHRLGAKGIVIGPTEGDFNRHTLRGKESSPFLKVSFCAETGFSSAERSANTKHYWEGLSNQAEYHD